MKKILPKVSIVLSLFFFLFLFSCEQEEETTPLPADETISTSSSISRTSGTVDCPQLGLNYHDTCKTRDGRIGLVARGCKCDPFRKADSKDTSSTRKDTSRASYDCQRIKMNYGDACKTARGERGKIDRTCTCSVPKKYDCPSIQKNIGDACRTPRGQRGTVDRSCNCT